MDDLTRYVICHYGALMTAQERQDYRTIMRQEKMAVVNSPAMRARLQNDLVSKDPTVMALLAEGSDVFLNRVRGRILSEHSGDVFLNYCPRCGKLARTPRAKLCVHCYFEWRKQ